MLRKPVTKPDMARRKKMPERKSKRVFSHTADTVHSANVHSSNPMRGGIRL